MRLDLFLKTARLVKRRAVAKELCEEGRVFVNERSSQPAKEVRPGDRIRILYATKALDVEVLALPPARGRAAAEPPFRIIAETRTDRPDII